MAHATLSPEWTAVLDDAPNVFAETNQHASPAQTQPAEPVDGREAGELQDATIFAHADGAELLPVATIAASDARHDLRSKPARGLRHVLDTLAAAAPTRARRGAAVLGVVGSFVAVLVVVTLPDGEPASRVDSPPAVSRRLDERVGAGRAEVKRRSSPRVRRQWSSPNATASVQQRESHRGRRSRRQSQPARPSRPAPTAAETTAPPALPQRLPDQASSPPPAYPRATGEPSAARPGLPLAVPPDAPPEFL